MLAHLTSDAYSSFLSPLLPLIVTKHGLSLTDVGTLVAVSSFTSSLCQPVFGAWADRLRRPWFVAFGPLLTALFMSSLGLAPTFVTLLLAVTLGGIGSAAFHPQAAALAGATGRRRAESMSMFVTGGTVGFTAGPLVAVAVASRWGLEGTWIACGPGVLMSGVLIAWFLRVPLAPRATEFPRIEELRAVWKPLASIYLCGVFRTVVSFGFMTFLPLLLHREGMSVGAGGVVLAVFVGCGILGSLMGGWAADRWGGRRVIVLSFGAALPLFVAFTLLPIEWGLGCLVIGNTLLLSSLPVNVIMGQELSPRHASTVSSLLMGAAWGMGQLLVAPAGALADAYGLRVALLVLGLAAAAGLVAAWSLPRRAGSTLVASGA
jgi:FSR family fosmidomycin resistance protein-like MFS transporter